MVRTDQSPFFFQDFTPFTGWSQEMAPTELSAIISLKKSSFILSKLHIYSVHGITDFACYIHMPWQTQKTGLSPHSKTTSRKSSNQLSFFIILLFYLVLGQNFLCCPGCPGTRFVDQAGFKLTEIDLSLPRGVSPPNYLSIKHYTKGTVTSSVTQHTTDFLSWNFDIYLDTHKQKYDYTYLWVFQTF